MTTRKTQNAMSVNAQACLVAALVGCSMPASSKSLGVHAKRGRVAGSSLGGVEDSWHIPLRISAHRGDMSRP
eukprot:CAMPEP_0204002488 /NCGR_PEP_ID=MMETSP0360-20130528/16947_1 /ASSEMBLY_ACC=CAM_ASM_000342 /TAXON_ID=268821 /ORGANISM="Scrippsiella Hangoei, Strain SHTV-5" /LENGTH=71 /DNA_ID=CAMNT_0050944105 /DNA_START=585 /DNA_END=799 /DNA_ORIENTATION=+